MRKGLKIIEKLLFLISVLAIIVGVAIIFLYAHKNEDGLFKFGDIYFLSVNDSDMTPNFKKGDLVEIFTPSGTTYEYKIENIYDEDMNELDVARHPEEVLKLPFDKEVEEYSMIRLIRGA